MKLAPGIDRELLPADAEHQWVTDGLETVEAVVWTGRLAREGVARSALVLGDGGAAELTGEASHPEPASSASGSTSRPGPSSGQS